MARAIITTMAEPEVSMAAAVRALQQAGFTAELRGVPDRPAGPPAAGAWVALPGDEAYAVVTVLPVVPAEQRGWRCAYPDEHAVRGYRITFHERPFRTRGHGCQDAADERCSVFTDEVVATVREWSSWEATWSVTPTGQPASRRTAYHRRLAAAKLASAEIPVDVELDPLFLLLLDAEQVTALHATVDDLFLPGIRWRFPRNRIGSKLATRTQVLLRECAPPAHPAGKGIWLVVDGPAPRAEQRLTVRLARVAGRSAQHRWDRQPEYWRGGPRALDQLWGTDDTGLAEEITDLLTAGETREALHRCGVRVDRGTTRLLSGLPDCYELRAWTDSWVTNAVASLADAAPWHWRAAAAGQRRPRRLVSLGGFNPSRRPGLFLSQQRGQPVLSFDQSASPLVVPRTDWQRDLDLDLVRAGLLARHQIPIRADPADQARCDRVDVGGQVPSESFRQQIALL